MSSIILKQLRFLLTFLGLFLCFAVKSQCPCSGNRVNQSDLDKYIKNFKGNFSGGGTDKKHTQWVYLSENYFLFFKDFLDKEGMSADGIWIYFVSHGRIIDADQQKDSNQIMIQTVASINHKPDFDKLRLHNVTSAILTTNNSVYLSTKTKNSSTIGPAAVLGSSKLEIQENYIRYNENFPSSSYSLRLHVCREQIDQIVKVLQTSGYNGVKLNFGSYNFLSPCGKNKYKNQYSLFLVPVSDQNSFANIDKYNNTLSKQLSILQSNIYNHGSLCPADCTQ